MEKSFIRELMVKIAHTQRGLFLSVVSHVKALLNSWDFKEKQSISKEHFYSYFKNPMTYTGVFN